MGPDNLPLLVEYRTPNPKTPNSEPRTPKPGSAALQVRSTFKVLIGNGGASILPSFHFTSTYLHVRESFFSRISGAIGNVAIGSFSVASHLTLGLRPKDCEV